MKRHTRLVLAFISALLSGEAIHKHETQPVVPLIMSIPGLTQTTALIVGSALIMAAHNKSRFFNGLKQYAIDLGIAPPAKRSYQNDSTRQQAVAVVTQQVAQKAMTVKEQEEKHLFAQFSTADAQRLRSLSPRIASTPSYRTINTAHGIRVEHESGLYAQIEQRPQHPAQKRYEEYFQSDHFWNRVRAEYDPEYYKSLVNQVDVVFRHFASCNSPDFVERTIARINLVNLYLDPPLSRPLAVAIHTMLRYYFSDNGDLRRPDRDDVMPYAARAFAQSTLKSGSISSISSKPEFSPKGPPPSQSFGERLTQWVRRPHDMSATIRNSRINQTIIRIIELCNAGRIKEAEALPAAVEGMDFRQAIVSYYQEKRRSLLYNKEGIFRTVEDDLLYRTLPSQERRRLETDLQFQTECNTLLLQRRNLRTILHERWEIPYGNQEIEDFLCILLNRCDLFSDPRALASYVIDTASTQPTINALFLPNGVFKDFADYPYAKTIEVTPGVLSPHNTQLRHTINEQLLEKTQKNTVQYTLKGASILAHAHSTTDLNEHEQVKQNKKPLIASQDKKYSGLGPGKDPDPDDDDKEEKQYDGDQEQLKRELEEDRLKERSMGPINTHIKKIYLTTHCYYRYLHKQFLEMLNDKRTQKIVDQFLSMLEKEFHKAGRTFTITKEAFLRHGIPYQHIFEGKPNARGGISGYHMSTVFKDVMGEMLKKGNDGITALHKVHLFDINKSRTLLDEKTIFIGSVKDFYNTLFKIINPQCISNIRIKNTIISILSEVNAQQYILKFDFTGVVKSVFGRIPLR